ncbi:substrate-binding domain-containing protein [Blautia sp. RD014234]|nr:substrate-binding domain-containing protein [Blautia parvula]
MKIEIQPFIIGCHSSFELTMLPEALRQLTKAYPQVHPDIKMVPSQALRNLLQEETLDVMLGFGEDKEKKKTGTYVELIKAPVVCVTAGDHALAKKTRSPWTNCTKAAWFSAILTNPPRDRGNAGKPHQHTASLPDVFL